MTHQASRHLQPPVLVSAAAAQIMAQSGTIQGMTCALAQHQQRVNVNMSAAHQHLRRRLLLPLTVSHPDSGSPSQSAGNHAMVCVAATRIMPAGPKTRELYETLGMAHQLSLSCTHQAARACRHEVFLRGAVDAAVATGRHKLRAARWRRCRGGGKVNRVAGQPPHGLRTAAHACVWTEYM